MPEARQVNPTKANEMARDVLAIYERFQSVLTESEFSHGLYDNANIRGCTPEEQPDQASMLFYPILLDTHTSQTWKLL